MAGTRIEERGLERLLRAAPQLLGKQYVCRNDHECGKLPHIREHVYTVAGESPEVLYLARESLSKKRASRDDPIEFDSDGHPFRTVRYGDRSVAEYDRLFLGNTGFACAMGQLHQQEIDKVYGLLQEGRGPRDVLPRFDEYIDGFIARIPELKDRIVRAWYRGDLKKTLDQIPYADRTALGLLALKGGTPHATEFDLRYARRPGDLFRDEVRVTEPKRRELFRAWYRNGIDTAAYERKIREYERKNDEAFSAYVQEFEESLRRHGFEKVPQIRGL